MYFDNAATSYPKPDSVYETLDTFLRTAGANPGRSGHRMAVAADRAIAGARQRLARLINAPDPRRIIWTSNCTGALNLALKGFLAADDHVVTTQLEHNSVRRPLRALELQGVGVTRVDCPGGALEPAAVIEALRPETRLVALVHASNVTGAVLPVGEIAAECRKRGVRVLLDAAQTAGAYPLDVRDLGVDMVAMPGHKSLLGPPGTGALYVGAEIELRPLMEGGTGTDSDLDAQPDRLPDRLEAGTLNTVGIAGLGAAVEWIEATGVETIRRHESALLQVIWEGVAGIPGVTLYGPLPGAGRVGVLSFNLGGWEPTDLAAVLDEHFDVQCRAGLHCAPGAHQAIGTFPSGTVRLSPGYFNTTAEAESVVAAVRELGG
jgi:cysteine desulfurase/selenocysteine lyase